MDDCNQKAAKEDQCMAEYSIPKKDPYIVKVKSGESLSSKLKNTTPRGRKTIEDSAKKFKSINIRKGW